MARFGGDTRVRPDPVEPTRVATNNAWSEYEENHPAYGMIGASRVSGGAYLYGSDFRHQHWMTIRIHHGRLLRSDLSYDHYMAEGQIIEVELSEAQWATFVSAANVGDGVPCTINWVVGEGFLPELTPPNDRRKQFRGELDKRFEAAIARLRGLYAEAKTEKLRREIGGIINAFTDGMPWVAKQFDEHTEATIERAKMEVNAYVTQTLMRAGATALGAGEGSAPEAPLELTSSAEDR